MNRVLKRTFAILAILLIVAQSFFTSVASAGVQPWTGNPWEGESWNGNPWDPNQFKWQGESWTGNDWEGTGTNGNGTTGNGTTGNGTTGTGTTGNDTTGNDTNGNGTNGNGTTGNGTTGNGTSGDGTTGNGTTGNGTSGDGTTGNGTAGNGTTGDGTTGNGTNGNNTTGNGTAGDGTTGNGTSGDGTTGIGTNGNGTTGNGNGYDNPTPGEVSQYVGFNLIHSQVGLMASLEQGTTATNMGVSSGFFLSGLLLNGLKLKYEGNPYLEGALLANDFGDKGYVAGQSYLKVRDALATSRTAMGGTRGAQGLQGAFGAYGPTFGQMGALGKLNVVGAGAAALYGGYETFVKGKAAWDSYSDPSVSTSAKVANTSEATASLGATIMSAGVVVGAIPGLQAAGTIMVVGGAALWGASKLTGLVAKNWGSIKNGVKNAGSFVADKVSSGWNALKGVFG